MDCPWNSLGQNTGVGGLSLLQGIFPTQGLNPGLLHCRWILYQLSHKVANILMGYLCKEGYRVNVIWLGTIMLSATSRSADF